MKFRNPIGTAEVDAVEQAELTAARVEAERRDDAEDDGTVEVEESVGLVRLPTHGHEEVLACGVRI